ncbi:MAG TPA: diacylglycerol kinase family protein [Verrucomicrobiae bacterium]|nr:diacylglycerol kinase family protein [Verrucomicrobiae bacterium]
MDKIFVIFNPAARGEKSRRARRFLEAKDGPSMTLAPTQRAGEAKALAAQAVAEGYKTIVAAGGDGTINEVINGIGTSGVALAVLPLGTVNVFAKELCISGKLDTAWETIQAAHTRTIDLAQADTNGSSRYFIQLAGVGFDAHAVRTASWGLKKKIGPLSYVWAGIKALSVRHAPVEVSVNGSGPLGRGVAVLVGNGRFYGGRFALFPRARMDDGLLDVCVFQRAGYWDALRYAQGIVRAAHINLGDVKYFQAEKLVCRAADPVAIQLDGEDAGDAPVTFSVVARALRVIAPKPAAARSPEVP